ncbi:MAG: hypothetical protein ACKPCP_30910 [Sphaerospermopsis kisseleviana]
MIYQGFRFIQQTLIKSLLEQPPPQPKTSRFLTDFSFQTLNSIPWLPYGIIILLDNNIQPGYTPTQSDRPE